MLSRKILVIYPQVNDTKIAVFQNNSWVFFKTINIRPEEIKSDQAVLDQEIPRTEQILKELKENDIRLDEIKIVMGRGGLVKPIKSGIYEINEALKNDLRQETKMHETNLGGLIADRIAAMIPDARAFLADPVVVDEMDEIAKVSGHPMFERKSIFHALNHKFAGRNYAKSVNEQYENLNLIIAHVGEGGISVGAHRRGKVVDVNQAYDGDGPFSYSRSGSLPYGDLIEICYNGKYTKKELRQKLVHEGGLLGHLGTNNINLIEIKIKEGDKKSEFVFQAMAYQLAKEIGAMYVVLEEPLDAIILSGNIFQSKYFTDAVKRRILKLGKVIISPFVSDMDALADSAMLIMKDEAEILIYE
ncbi:MAG: butyrate kinase [Bacteroidales bacterium]|nr:butyrate kinase [Bacteroidales bacterium]